MELEKIWEEIIKCKLFDTKFNSKEYYNEYFIYSFIGNFNIG